MKLTKLRDLGEGFFEWEVTRVSPFSKRETTMVLEFRERDFLDWKEHGALIQSVLGYLSPDEREFLKTGITPDEWDNLPL